MTAVGPTHLEQTRDVAAEAAAIDASIAGRTLVSAFAETVHRLGSAEALRWKEEGVWQALTWDAYRQAVAEVALALVSLGLRPCEATLIMSRNRPEPMIADLATQHARGVPVVLYNTLAPEQVAFIGAHCGARIAFVENRDFLRLLASVREHLPKLERVVLMSDAPEPGDDAWTLSWQTLRAAGRRALAADPLAFEALCSQVQPNDLAAIVYTSGTTGQPKGVMISHRNVLWEEASTRRLHGGRSGERIISYLPLAHVNARWVDLWSQVILGSTVTCCPDSRQVFDYAREVHPTVMVGVPRVWEKLFGALKPAVADEPDPTRLQQLRASVGLDACERAYTGAAPIDPAILAFFQRLGVPLTEAWGMTELTCAASGAPPGLQRNGTIGLPAEGVEMRLAEDGEILVRAGCVMQGYHKDPAATAEAIDSDGWLHTGDVGSVDADGYYRIIGRKKDILITSGGKNVVPAAIESLLQEHPLVGNAVAIGDRRPYVTCLLVLDPEVAPLWARQHGLGEELTELAQHPRVVDELQQAVERANSHLARVEQVKRFRILAGPWTPQSGELTPTLKVRRAVVLERYAAVIEDLYR